MTQIKVSCTLYRFGIPYFWNHCLLTVDKDKAEDCKVSKLYEFMSKFSTRENIGWLTGHFACYEYGNDGILRNRE